MARNRAFPLQLAALAQRAQAAVMQELLLLRLVAALAQDAQVAVQQLVQGTQLPVSEHVESWYHLELATHTSLDMLLVLLAGR